MKKEMLMEADDLSLTPHVGIDSLPTMLKDCLVVGQTTQTKDIMLLSSLTAVSSVLENISFRYAHYGKRYWPMLQTFIMAGPASGKGIADVAKELVKPIHEAYGLFIPGDSTYPAFYELLYEQNGRGLLYETEGSVITDIWKNGCGNYNTALRKIAEHETLSKNRMADGRTEIDVPRMAMLLTGTFGQFRTLVPSIENGFFSRLTLLVVRGGNAFDETVFKPNNETVSASEKLTKWGKRLHETVRRLRGTNVTFRLSDSQAAQVGKTMAGEYGEYLKHLGEGFHANIVRNGVTMMRVAAILSGMRLVEDRESLERLLSEEKPVIECTDVDFQTAMVIATKLLLNAADAYNQIGGKKQVLVPAPQGSYQSQTFMASLPPVFTTGECVEQAQTMGVCERTARRWINNWMETGLLHKKERGLYKKVG